MIFGSFLTCFAPGFSPTNTLNPLIEGGGTVGVVTRLHTIVIMRDGSGLGSKNFRVSICLNFLPSVSLILTKFCTLILLFIVSHRVEVL